MNIRKHKSVNLRTIREPQRWFKAIRLLSLSCNKLQKNGNYSVAQSSRSFLRLYWANLQNYWCKMHQRKHWQHSPPVYLFLPPGNETSGSDSQECVITLHHELTLIKGIITGFTIILWLHLLIELDTQL